MKALKVALLSSVFALGTASLATAADIYQDEGSYKDAPEQVYYAPITWTGFYFGANLGYGFEETEICIFEDDDDDQETQCGDRDDFWLGGVHAGYNWQRQGPLVLGIEGDVTFGDDIDYLASIRGRIGYAFDSTLLYATGGAAFLGLEDPFGDDEDFTGWVAGAGFDHKLAQNVSFGLEGLYYDFDEDKFGEEADFWVARARLTYHMTRGYEEPLK